MVQQHSLFFPALLNKGADHINKQLRLCLWQGQESDSIDICAVHAKEHSLPPSPSRETRSGVPVRPQPLRSAVFSCLLTGGSVGPVTSLSSTPSSVCRC